MHIHSLIFNNTYRFEEAARSLEQVLLRLDEFIFILNNKDRLYPIIMLSNGNDVRLLYNIRHVTVDSISSNNSNNSSNNNNSNNNNNNNNNLNLTYNYKYYALLKYKKNPAIPFTDIPEPSPIYRVLGSYYSNEDDIILNDTNTVPNNPITNPTASSSNNDTNTIPNGIIPNPTNTIPTLPNPTLPTINNTGCLVAIHAKHKSFTYKLGKYLRKHERLRSSIFYAYNDAMVRKLRSKHFIVKILVASNSKDMIRKVIPSFRDFNGIIKVNDPMKDPTKIFNEVINRPKYSFLHKDNILSHIELLSLMLHDNIDNLRTTIDGVRPYTTSDMI